MCILRRVYQALAAQHNLQRTLEEISSSCLVLEVHHVRECDIPPREPALNLSSLYKLSAGARGGMSVMHR